MAFFGGNLSAGGDGGGDSAGDVFGDAHSGQTVAVDPWGRPIPQRPTIEFGTPEEEAAQRAYDAEHRNIFAPMATDVETMDTARQQTRFDQLPAISMEFDGRFPVVYADPADVYDDPRITHTDGQILAPYAGHQMPNTHLDTYFQDPSGAVLVQRDDLTGPQYLAEGQTTNIRTGEPLTPSDFVVQVPGGVSSPGGMIGGSPVIGPNGELLFPVTNAPSNIPLVPGYSVGSDDDGSKTPGVITEPPSAVPWGLISLLALSLLS